jgi:hypothetical protein
MKLEVTKPAGPQSLEAGILLGQNQAFALIAGRCSAAQAAAIRRLRNEKLYRSVTTKWGEFCLTRLRMSRRSADQIIALFDEFGPDYFEVAQITRVSPETYRAIQPSIRDGALHHDGHAIALIEANAQQVAAAVAQMRQSKSRAPEPTIQDRLKALHLRCIAISEEFSRLGAERDTAPHRALVASTLDSVRLLLSRVRMTL